MLRLDVHGSPIKITGSGAYGTTPSSLTFFHRRRIVTPVLPGLNSPVPAEYGDPGR